MKFRQYLCMSVAIAAFGPAAAFAQSTDSGTSAPPDRDASDIIVTAQRRSQRLQDVPVSVSALTAGEIAGQGIRSTHEVAQAVTGITMTESGGYVQPFIRGIGSTTTNLGETGSAAFYIDGVYMPTINGQIYELANVESIQVLKGPQGTLFGRNANAGAILITTKAPQFQPHMSVNIGAGNYKSRSASGYVTAPLSDQLAFSVSGNIDKHGGYFINKNPNNGLGLNAKIGNAERWTLRASILYRATDNLDLTITGDGMRSDDASGIILQPINRYQGYTAGGLLPTGPYDYIGNEDIHNIAQQQGISGRVNWDLDSIKFTSTTAYRHYGSRSINYDSDTTPARIASISNNDVGTNFTQEFLLNSNSSSAITWVLGAFYLRQDGRLDPQDVAFSTSLQRIYAHQITDAYAAFGDATLKLGAFELTGGLRYSYETKILSGTRNGTPVLTNVKANWNSLTPRAVIAYHPNRAVMVYGSFTKGFKSGAFNTSSLSSVPIDPEKVEAFEVGGKFTLDRGFTVNIAAFKYKTTDLQVQALNPVTALIELRNAAKVGSQGVDLELAYSPANKLNVRAAVSYLDAKFDSFPNAQVFLPVPGGDGRNAPSVIDVTGKRNVRSPEWTMNLAMDYTWDLPGGGSLNPSFNVYYVSKFFWTVDNRIFEPAHPVVNASLTWNLPGERFSVTVWGRNIFDELRFRNVSASGQADRRAADEPGLFGVRFGYHF